MLDQKPRRDGLLYRLLCKPLNHLIISAIQHWWLNLPSDFSI